MATQFVILASGLKDGANGVEVDNLFAKYRQVDEILPTGEPKNIDGIANVVGGFFSNSDGGNGGGGGDSGGAARKVVVADGKRTFWRFPKIVTPPPENRETKFPPLVRWELCILVASYGDVVQFFEHGDGRAIADNFDWVQYVALSTVAA